jgi:hypothetical protein
VRNLAMDIHEVGVRDNLFREISWIGIVEIGILWGYSII